MSTIATFLFPEELEPDLSPIPRHPSGFLPLLNHLDTQCLRIPEGSGSAFLQTYHGEAVFLGFLQTDFRMAITAELECKKDCCWFVFPIWSEAEWRIQPYRTTCYTESYVQQGFFLPAGRHQLYLPDGWNWLYSIAVTGKYMENMLEEFKELGELKENYVYGEPNMLPPCTLPGRTVELLSDLTYREFARLSLQLFVKKMIYTALQEYNRQLAKLQQPKAKQSEVLFNKAIAYIREHFMEADLCTEGIAGVLCVSVATLNRAFEHRSANVKAYILFLRLMRAKLWLQTTDMTVKEVAYAVHYTDEKYFVKAYKKRFMIHPKYRRDQMPDD
jgi:AraC-like DNA-binding protein